MKICTLKMVAVSSFLLFFVIGFPPASGLAQTVTARLSGNVVDASGAAVPLAHIIATNTATGVQTQTISRADGSYIFPALSPGVYDLRAEKPGFKASVMTGIRLLVDQKASIDIHLAVGAVSTSVQVSGTAPLVETTTASVGTVISGQQAVELPLNQRQYGALALLVPGTTTDNGGFANNPVGSPFEATTYSANGSLSSSNNYLIDGVDSRNLIHGGFSVEPPPDSIQEFKIQTNIYSAAFGKTAGSTINLVIKSGTNEFHGGVYEFLRNDAFDARNFFATSKPEFVRNQFGFDIGGPIQKDKTFFFANYDALRYVKGLTLTRNVPTAAELQGDFASQLTGQTINLCGAGGPSNLDFDSGQLFNPGTESNFTCPTGSAKAGHTILVGTPVPGNIITNINPVAKRALQFNIWPAPNRAGTPNFINQDPDRRADNISVVRVDHTFSPKDQVFTHYIFGQSNLDTYSNSVASGLPGFGDIYYDRSQQAALGWTHTFGANLLNQATFGFDRDYFDLNCAACPSAPGTLASFGIQNLLPPSPSYEGSPFFDFSNFASSGTSEFHPNIQPDMVEKYADALTWIHGRQTVTVGADVQFWQVLGRFVPTAPRGQLAFNGQYSSLAGEIPGVKSISDLADFLQGYPDQASDTIEYLGINEVGGRWWSFYGQDDFKVTRKLTLNMGLRFEYRRLPYDKRDNIATWIPTGPAFSGPGNAILLTAAPAALNDSFCTDPSYAYLHDATGQCLIGTAAQRAQLGFTGYAAKSLVYSPTGYWAPRFGIAWRPTNSDKFVIRTGYGIFIDTPNGNNLNVAGNNPIFTPTTQYTTALGQPPPLTNGLPTTSETVFAGAARIPPLIDQSLQMNVSPDYRYPYVQEWSFGVSSQLANDWALELNYIGNKGTDLSTLHDPGNQPLPGLGPLQPRRPYPGLNSIVYVSSNGNSNYNALQARLERRMSKDFTLLTSFTWARGMDDNGGDEETQSLIQNDNDIEADYGRFADDARHNLVVSGVYALPFGQGEHFLNQGGLVNTALGGWQLSGIVTYQSGFPFNISTSTDYSNTGSPQYRPDRICNGAGPKTVAEWFDTSCFTTVYEQAALAAGNPRFGNAARNILDAPPLHDWDIALLKNFNLSDRFTLQFRSEFYNLFNTPHFSAPNGVVGTSTFGQITSTLADPRDIQFGLKLLF